MRKLYTPLRHYSTRYAMPLHHTELYLSQHAFSPGHDAIYPETQQINVHQLLSHALFPRYLSKINTPCCARPISVSPSRYDSKYSPWAPRVGPTEPFRAGAVGSWILTASCMKAAAVRIIHKLDSVPCLQCNFERCVLRSFPLGILNGCVNIGIFQLFCGIIHTSGALTEVAISADASHFWRRVYHE